ncbi:hypothetical protein L195_g015836 [Trifolium pratense]|uniref:Uncharacterized protein n=1 Tax=Trifolium pratense TaxID=57577 RepID=A0A2K3MPH5_TRIPR|nr:hypothetical protein L195_g015836 [Trifolium pratense]
MMAVVASNGELATIFGKLLGCMVLRMTEKMLCLGSLKHFLLPMTGFDGSEGEDPSNIVLEASG